VDPDRRGPGRPGRLTPELVDAIVNEISSGAGLGEAARACGVGERTLRSWRRRAWSPRAADAPYIDLERRIVGAVARAKATEISPAPWEEAAAVLEAEHPERWALPKLDDVLAELE
jgi:transposase-like protein